MSLCPSICVGLSLLSVSPFLDRPFSFVLSSLIFFPRHSHLLLLFLLSLPSLLSLLLLIPLLPLPISLPPSQLFPTRTLLYFSITRLGFHWDPEKITRDVASRTAELLRRRDEERKVEEHKDAATQRHGEGKHGGVDIEMSAVGDGAGGVADNNDNTDNLERLTRDNAQNYLAKQRREAANVLGRQAEGDDDREPEPLRWGAAVQWGPLRVFWLGEEGKEEPKRVKKDVVCVVICGYLCIALWHGSCMNRFCNLVLATSWLSFLTLSFLFAISPPTVLSFSFFFFLFSFFSYSSQLRDWAV